MMSPEQLRELLDTYGSREQRWPPDQRLAMRASLDAHPQLQQQLLAARELDAMLDSYVPPAVDLEARIFAALPRSASERLLNWLLPDVPRLWWRPALAAALPLVLGLAIGIESQNIISAGVTSDWEQQERSLLLPLAGADWYE
ncbi:MAG: hypothetical protein NWQ45_00480 [Congregibacter sp.]|nr:hypothetical protein [Congregibacter sp.]